MVFVFIFTSVAGWVQILLVAIIIPGRFSALSVIYKEKKENINQVSDRFSYQTRNWR
jgi:hypothetical protein